MLCWVTSGSVHPSRVHATQFLLELRYLVAQAGRQLELQLRGGGMHLVTELLDQIGEIGRGHAGQIGGVLAGRDTVGKVLASRYRGLSAARRPTRSADQFVGVGVLTGQQFSDIA